MGNEKATLELIGMTKDELRDRVVGTIVHEMLHKRCTDEDGGYEGQSDFRKVLDKQIKQSIDDTVSAIAEAHVMPVVADRIENVVLQRTTEWGEKKGEPQTFIEYLLHRADSYMTEPVASDGKPKKKGDSYWKAAGTRIEYLIDSHLHSTIAHAMKEALKNANSSIVGGIEAAVKVKLQEIAEGMKCEVKMPR